MMEFFDIVLSNTVIASFVYDALQSEIARMTIAFMIAAYAHRRWVKKDMKENFQAIKESVDHLAKAMKQGFAEGAIRFQEIEAQVKDLKEETKELKSRQGNLEFQVSKITTIQ